MSRTRKAYSMIWRITRDLSHMSTYWSLKRLSRHGKMNIISQKTKMTMRTPILCQMHNQTYRIMSLEDMDRPTKTWGWESVMSHIEYTQRDIDCRPIKKEKTAAISKQNPKRPLNLIFKQIKAMTKKMITIGLVKLRKRSNSMAI